MVRKRCIVSHTHSNNESYCESYEVANVWVLMGATIKLNDRKLEIVSQSVHLNIKNDKRKDGNV